MNETELRDLLREVDRIPGPDPEIPPHVLQRSRRRITITLGATFVSVVLVAGSLLGVRELLNASPSVPDGVPGGGTRPSVTGPPPPSVAPEADGIDGLPLVGARPSRSEHGRLVLYLEGNVGVPSVTVWVYADGRVIWGDTGGYFPSGAPTEGATGFVEQHLTPEGVEFLQSQVLATGLFERDLELLIDRPGFLAIEARNGDRLIQVTWAWDGIVGEDAPSATSERTSALESVYDLLAHPESWPASVWQDEDPQTYVPSRYQVWLRVFPDHGGGPSTPVGERELGLLPTAAADILRGGTDVREATYEVTTDDVRAMASAFNAAGLEPWPSPTGEDVLRYTLEDPFEPGSSLWVFVGPVLPHGEAVFLGPG